MDLLADISFGVFLVAGLLLIGGFLFVANVRDARNVKHPGGARGRMLDELMVLAPMVLLLVNITIGAFAPALRDASWWLPVLFAFAVVGIGLSFTPPVQRARQRLAALRGDPAQ